ncbi:MAG: SdrD B-like domain-containing protein [Kiritimatiellia bacterium]
MTDVDGLAFDASTSPKLYGTVRRALAAANDLLIQINTNTGQRVANALAREDYLVVSNASPVAGVMCDDVDDIAFDPSTGELYAILNDGGSNDLLAKISLADGSVTSIGPLGVDDAEGLAFTIDGSLFVSTGKDSRNQARRDSLFDLNKATGAASNQRRLAKEDVEAVSCFTANASIIGDLVWRDDNRNGVKDPSENGMSGVTVRLLRAADNAVIGTRVTGAGGTYAFVAPAGGYRIEVAVPAGFAVSPRDAGGNDTLDSDIDPADGRTPAFTVASGANDVTRDAGLFCLPPAITGPPNLVLQCPAGTTTNATGVATAASPCGCVTSLTYQDTTTPGCGSTSTITRRWTATDACGGVSFCDQTIQIVDTTQPVLAGVPAGTTVQCNAVPAAPTVTATDACDTSVVPVLTTSTTPGSCPQSYILTRTWTATDDCGNVRTASQAITVQDTTAPVFSGVGDPATIQCDQPIVFSTPTATDNCDATPTLTFADATVPGSCPQNFVRTRTWTATDKCGNVRTASQAITVRDTTKPVLVGVPANTTVPCDAIPAVPTVTATDNCDTSVIPVLTTATTPGSCAQSHTLTRTWTATDDCGNVQTAAQVITVQDTTAPVISGVGPAATIQCDQPIVFSTPTASDNCDTTPTLNFADATVPGSCPQNFVRTRTWTATDKCGNVKTASQAITVQDTTKPVITCPNALTVQCVSDVPAASPASVVATDNCGTATVTHDGDTATGTPCNRVITRTYRATDACGNFATCTQTITVVDNSRPVQTGFLQDQILQCVSQIPPPVQPVVVDNCDTSLTVSMVTLTDFSPVNCSRSTRYVWTFTDDCGNRLRITQTFFIRDRTKPVITCPAPVTLTGDGNCQAPLPALAPVVSDNCGAGGVTLVQSPPAGTLVSGTTA